MENSRVVRKTIRSVALTCIAALASLLVVSCNPTDSSQAPQLQLLAMPASIAAGSQTTLLLTVQGPCAAAGAACAVCLGEPAPETPTGTLYAPFDPSQGAATAALRIETATYFYPLAIIYQAPSFPGTRVLYATLGKDTVPCASGADGGTSPGGTGGAGPAAPAAGDVIAVTTTAIDVQPQMGTAGDAGSVDSSTRDASTKDGAGGG